MALYQVGGYGFHSKEDAKQAKKEEDGIAYIRARTNIDDPETAFKLYQKLVTEEVFETEVGYDFLKQLQMVARMMPQLDDSRLLPIPVAAKEAKKSPAKYKVPFFVALFFAIVFAVSVSGMFAITYFGGRTPNVLNYEQEIIDKYEAWEMELEEREKALELREQQL